jgi:myo-inositol-1(or 4)-monophosphatase
MIDYRAVCEEVKKTAEIAAAFIAAERKHFSAERVEHKGPRDPVTYVDKEAERLVVGRLHGILPEAGFVTEEGTVEAATDQRYKWLIDPLDGTTNFIHGLPPYCVSLALTEDDAPVVGVVYEVFSGECFYAWKGSKAFRNGEQIRTSSVARIEDTLTAVGFPHSPKPGAIDRTLQNIGYLVRNTSGIRRIGSAAADLCCVACGRVDAFYHQGLSPWDVAAGALIVEAAGGRVTDFAGGSNYLYGREIVAAGPLIFEEYRRLMASSLCER